MKRTTTIYLIALSLFCFSATSLFSQEMREKDSLNKYTFEELSKKFYAAKPDSLKAVMYAKYYIDKAKRERDTLKISDGNFFLSDITKDFTFFTEFWEIIIQKGESSSIKTPLIEPYISLGDFYLQKGKYKNALDNYFKAKTYAKKSKNDSIYYHIISRIGIIQNWQGNTKSAIYSLKKVYNYFNSNINNNSVEYSILLLQLASCYNKIGLQDSAIYYNQINQSSLLKLKDSTTYGYTIFIEGEIEFQKMNQNKAIQSFKKALPYIVNDYNYSTISNIYYYLGRSNNLLNKKEKSLSYYKKIDSLKLATNIIHSSQKPAYKFLANYYKEEKDDKKQLEYINKYIKVDSILNNRDKNINKNLKDNYDIPNLLAEKELIEKRLKQEVSSSNNMIIGITATSLVLLLFLLQQVRKRKLYKKRFQELIAISSQNRETREIIKPKKEQHISKTVLENISTQLEVFEENQDFLSTEVTLSSLAKAFETNSKYLSQVINQQKEQSFNNYINSLRIHYTVEKLKKDLIFRKYSIKAIANDVGFNTTESFSKAFYKNTGIRPSYFIKELKD